MNHLKFLSAAALLGFCGPAFAQVVPPDAGRVVTGNAAAAPKTPSESTSVPKFQGNAGAAAEKDTGPKAMVSSIALSGNTVFLSRELVALVQDRLGKPHGMAGMREIARLIGEHYRLRGYPFARAVIPAQDFKDGVLNILVLEGRYGLVTAKGEAAIAAGAQEYLAELAPGKVIEAVELEHALLVLDDVPGISVVPTVSPGSRVGTGDLTVQAILSEPSGGDFGVDNHGSRYTGQHRAHLNWFRNTGLVFGDRFSLGAMVTDEAMWLGSADYELPLDGTGWRAAVGYAHTSYELGKDFSALGAAGLAKIWTARLSYPFIRSQMFNLQGSFGFQHKTLQDDYESTATSERKFCQNFPLSLRFDKRDGFLGGAITYGQLTWTIGTLHLDDGLRAVDAVTAQKAGTFTKANLDLARIQRLGGNFSAYVRLSYQWANDNLDSVERLCIGGPQGVRAYPLGEGTADEGWLGQLELRYDLGTWAPFIFLDAGSVDQNHAPWDAASDKSRSISGAGVGVRLSYEKWSGDLTVASPLSGGAPQSDTRDPSVRVLFSATRSF